MNQDNKNNTDLTTATTTATQEQEGRTIVKTMEEVMHESMMPYSEYVIMDRALPRVEDGLKPVQRRVLYSMYDLGILPDKPHKKCARIVGDCLGKYHPHGDSSVYQAMVRMAQPFNMGSILVDGHGNFGSVDGDGAAAMRYTEARLAPLALELIRDIEKDTVRFSSNFDDTTTEPDYLPGRFPNLLVNGAGGIAVGLATNIPPHNLSETIDATVAYITNPRISLKEIIKIIKGPDFPTGGVVIPTELEKAYETGRGKIQIRAKIHIENTDNDKKQIVIDELPYQVNKAALLKSILDCREEKKDILGGISEIVDESDRSGIRAVIKIKKDTDPHVILNHLFKYTNLQVTFGINMVAIADSKPQQMGLIDIIAYYVDYQRVVVVRRAKFDLDAAKERLHIVEGLMIAVKNIDEVIKIIKASKNTSEAKERLKARFELSERQAQAIIDLRLGKLTSLEIYRLEQEYEELIVLIDKLNAILASKAKQFECIKTELLAIKKQFKYGRRSELIDSLADYKVPSDDDEKVIEECIVALNTNGDLKKMGVKSFSLATKEFNEGLAANEIYPHLIKMMSNQRLHCFTNMGNCFKVDCEEIPDGKWRGSAVSIKKVIAGLVEGEKIIFAIPLNEPLAENLPSGDLLFYTKKGMVKRSNWSEYGVIKSSYQAVKLNDGDEVVGMEHFKEGASLAFVTSGGICLNADMSDIPVQGRVSAGVKGIKLGDGDCCVAVAQIGGGGQKAEDFEIALVTESGLAKRVGAAAFDVIGRYSKGIKIIDLKDGAKVAYANINQNKDQKIVLEFLDGYLQCFSVGAFAKDSRTSVGKQLTKEQQKIKGGFVFGDKVGT
ncbi:MAG: DNA topoisomerase 4 subunit A [Firmicutes bacterium]|nr:DNA topoisomerase 4 subunit A [Bacillota bacterium]